MSEHGSGDKSGEGFSSAYLCELARDAALRGVLFQQHLVDSHLYSKLAKRIDELERDYAVAKKQCLDTEALVPSHVAAPSEAEIGLKLERERVAAAALSSAPDGYAVLLDDKASAPKGYWFAYAYTDQAAAEKSAAITKGRVAPIYFAPSSIAPPVIDREWWRAQGVDFCIDRMAVMETQRIVREREIAAAPSATRRSMEGIAPQPKYIEHITFEGRDCVVLSPEEYEALWDAATDGRAEAK